MEKLLHTLFGRRQQYVRSRSEDQYILRYQFIGRNFEFLTAGAVVTSEEKRVSSQSQPISTDDTHSER